eukprot:288990-Prymnesium_polylepis.1
MRPPASGSRRPYSETLAVRLVSSDQAPSGHVRAGAPAPHSARPSDCDLESGGVEVTYPLLRW